MQIKLTDLEVQVEAKPNGQVCNDHIRVSGPARKVARSDFYNREYYLEGYPFYKGNFWTFDDPLQEFEDVYFLLVLRCNFPREYKGKIEATNIVDQGLILQQIRRSAEPLHTDRVLQADVWWAI
jgi:hypothetical protein